MAINNNLEDYLIDIADILRYINGTNSKINVQDFQKEILELVENQIYLPTICTFYDYDGTVLYKMNILDILKKGIPPLPEKEGLIYTMWSSQLPSYQGINFNYDKIDICAICTTDDGSTRLYLKIENESELEVSFIIDKTESCDVSIDWGDEYLENAIDGSNYHVYSSVGDYVIKIQSTGIFNITGFCRLTSSGSTNPKILRKIEFGNHLGDVKGRYNICNFAENEELTSVTAFIPEGLGIIDVSNCQKISFAFIYGKPTFVGMGITALTGSSVKKAIIQFPETSNWARYGSAFSNCTNISSITLQDGPSSLSGTFTGCSSLKKIIIPPSVTSIQSGNFSGCTALNYCEIRSKSVPTLYNPSANFEGVPVDCKFVVPASFFDDYIASTDWESVRSQIVSVNKPCRFDIGSEPRISEFGYTWAQWMTSDLYNGNYSIVDGYVMSDSTNNVQLNGNNVMENDVIIHNAEYSILVND